MSQVPIDYKFIMSVFKKALRERGMKYRDLANKIKISESGLKKVFAAHDGSLSRLHQIATALDLNLIDIMTEYATEDVKAFSFNREQQNLFAQNPSVFHFYFKLVIERRTTSEIKVQYGFSEAELFKYLRKLDQARLIKMLPNSKIKIPSLAMIKNFGSGQFLTDCYQEWSRKATYELARPENQEDGRFIVRCLRMKDATYKEFMARLIELETEFLRRALREMSLSLASTKPMRWISVTDQKSFVEVI